LPAPIVCNLPLEGSGRNTARYWPAMILGVIRPT
jgi:hypothetical protein